MISESPELRSAIFSALAACLGLSADSAAASALIHPAYAEPENGPRPPRDRNVIYYALSQEADEDDLPQSSPDAVFFYSGSSTASQDAPPASFDRTVRSFLAYQLLVVCYGPSAEHHAHLIRTRLFQDGAGKPRALLRAAGAYPLPHPSQPVLLHEVEGSLWRSRADLTLSLRVRDELTQTVRALSAPPEIHLKS